MWAVCHNCTKICSPSLNRPKNVEHDYFPNWSTLKSAFLSLFSSRRSRSTWWRQRLIVIHMLIWFGVRKSTRTRATTTTSSPASAPPSAVPAPSGEFVAAWMTSVSVCAVSVCRLMVVCVCVCLQVCGSWACSSSSYWEQADAPHGAAAFTGHGVRSGGVLRKPVTSGLHLPLRSHMLPACGAAPPQAAAFPFLHWCVFPQYIYISALLSGVTFKQNAQWSTDFEHCYHGNLRFTVMDTTIETNVSKPVLNLWIYTILICRTESLIRSYFINYKIMSSSSAARLQLNKRLNSFIICVMQIQ